MSTPAAASGTKGTPTERPEELDRTDPDRHVAEAAEAFRNWGRWGDDDRLGTLNFIDDAARTRAAGLVRRGTSFSLSQPFDINNPQQGWRRHTNPVHTMLDTGTDAAAGTPGFPHGLGGADDVIAMPLQCSTQWDSYRHIFNHGIASNGRPPIVVTSDGDLVTGMEHAASAIVGRGVLLDWGGSSARGVRRRPGRRAAGRLRHHDRRTRGVHRRAGRIEHSRPRRPRARAHRALRTRAARGLENGYAGGPSAGLSFTTAGWLYRTEIAAIATDTWGFEVQPNEFDEALQPLHQ